MEKPTLYILIGLPGSGKTTKAKEIINEYAKEHDLMENDIEKQFSWQSSDYYRGMICYEKKGIWDEGDQSVSKLAFQRLNTNTIEQLKNGVSVIYDTTNLVASKREELISSLRKDGLSFDAVPVFVNTDAETCKKRSKERYIKMCDLYERTKDTDKKASVPRTIPDDVIDRMARLLTKPTLLEGYAVPGKTPQESRYETIINIIKEKVKKNELEYISTFNYIEEKLNKNPYINLSIFASCIKQKKYAPRQIELILDVVESHGEEAKFLTKNNFTYLDMKYVKTIMDSVPSETFSKIRKEFKTNTADISGFQNACLAVLGKDELSKITNKEIEDKKEI